MTAIVGILNKRAAVMAADSAVTVTNGGKSKIYNTGTKIFRLSIENPVGVMIFSSVEFMGTPWDVIFKLYRDKRGMQSFNTLKEYAQNFVDFLSAENYFSSAKSQKDYFIDELSNFYYTIKDEVLEQYQSETKDLSEEEMANLDSEARICTLLGNELERVCSIYRDKGINHEFEDYTIDNMLSFSHNEFDELMSLCQEEDMPTNMRDKWESSFHSYICSQHYYNGTGIVFVGYGNKDIYPSLLPMYISGAFDHRMRYFFEDIRAVAITNDDCARICPFAQTDVMMSLMKGVSPGFYRTALDSYENSINSTKKKMIQAMKEAGATEEVLEKAESVDFEEMIQNHREQLSDYIQNEFVNGIIDAVDSFSIDDMANMAESLISVTNLQRHISSSDESVGGPIDVAVITRSEGFIWVKHKQWFHQDLNPHTRVYE
jgi:hypothetical protein